MIHTAGLLQQEVVEAGSAAECAQGSHARAAWWAINALSGLRHAPAGTCPDGPSVYRLPVKGVCNDRPSMIGLACYGLECVSHLRKGDRRDKSQPSRSPQQRRRGLQIRQDALPLLSRLATSMLQAGKSASMTR